MAQFDYKHILEKILWFHCGKDENEESGFYEIVGEPNEWNRGEYYPKGTLLDFNPMILSFSIPAYKPLSWKELSLKLGLNVPYLVSDGHDCQRCPDRNKCHAYFKDKPEQSACNYWYTEVDGSIYQANIDKYTIKEEPEDTRWMGGS